MVELIKSDLEFILQQIIIAEQHAAGADLLSLLPNSQVPFGLRTVDGTFNHLLPGQENFGAADELFPRLTDPVFRPAEAGTSYAQTSNTFVIDSQPRIISNLIVDQTSNNPAAVAAAAANPFAETITSPGLDGIFGTADDVTNLFSIPNTAPDAGLSAPFNLWFVFFGQFFDHGLDLVQKGGSGTVFIPLQPDDPLFNPGPDGIPNTADDGPNFMLLTRATNQPGPDGILGTADDIHEHLNTTSPFVDQNQTFTSHPSHQVFLRAYEFNATGDPVNTGKLIVNRTLGGDGEFGTADDVVLGGMATWGVVKAQARDLLGIQLTDYDALNVPLVAVDAYGNFKPGPNGFAQLVVGLGPDGLPLTADDLLLEGNPAANGGLGVSTATALRTGHMFLADIAHSANPFNSFGVPLTPDADDLIGDDLNPATYDDELLDRHFMAGDGRVNENIGLTAVHHVFHAEHNRLVEHVKDVVLATAATGDVSFLNQWLATPVTTVPADPATLVWNGARLFQAAKFGTEMQYQHLVFEEFARKIQPNVDEFLTPNGFNTFINPAIVAEFAHTVYRFGHSMLLETIDRLDPNFASSEIGLIAAFLNPLAFNEDGTLTPEEAAGAIVRGTTRQVGNEIDEFKTEALRNNLLGLPLDLATVNLARGRDTGIPSLNAARREFHDVTGDSHLTPYTSWNDYLLHLKHPESVVNFIAAYGTHASITAAATLADKRAAATLLVFGGVGEPADRFDFLNSTGAYASGPDGVTTTGVDAIDFWIGGLAEKQMPFGGFLGSTFNFVFETQLEALQDGDRLYYLARLAGTNFLNELENNSFAKLIMANTDTTHLPNDVFSTPGLILEVTQAQQFNPSVVAGPDGIEGTPDDLPANADPVGDSLLIPLVIRDNPATPGPDTNFLQYTGADHVVLGGTPGNDIIISSEGDDTLYGDEGNDRLEGGYGNDFLLGGPGDDIITDIGGDDNIQAEDGNDVIHGGNGANLILGGRGNDFIVTGEDITETFAGEGNDFILGAKTNIPTLGNEGDDWIEIGTQDGAPGDNFDPFNADTVTGNDVFITGGGFDEPIAEGGDDIMVGSDGEDHFDGGSGFDWATFQFDRFGVKSDMNVSDLVEPPVAPSNAGIMDRFAFTEGMSGSALADILRGDDADAVEILAAGPQGSVLTNIALINGLQEFLGAGVTSFGSGNIILGGDGSDMLEGRGGNDLIDGDRTLSVRISVRENPDGTGAEIRSVYSMKDLVPDMLAGAINPGQLVAVREILPGSGAFNFDTAMFHDVRANYSVVTDANGTTVVTHNAVTRPGDTRFDNGIDRLTNIERLQFSDQALVLTPGLNAEPVGQLTILDAATNAADNTPAIGQLLRVSALGVTDGDNVSPTNPTGAITGPVSYIWQFEEIPGSGIFRDIVTEGGDKPSTADSATFRVTPDLAGLAIRVRAIYQDGHDVLESASSTPTAPVTGVATLAPPPVTLPDGSTVSSKGVHLIQSDLQFILDQTIIAERHAAGEDILDIIPNSRLALGLRTVDGSFNNLVQGQSGFGAADEVFPRLLDPVFRPAEAGTSYVQTSNTFVIDSQPRIISNLIVDQTSNNPAAVAAAAANPFAETITSPGLDGIFGTDDDVTNLFSIPNTAPDAGLSAPFNLWFVFFGQFFDHGLDLVQKGGSGTVFIPLQPDDPLFVPGSPTNFMLLTRATNQPGPDGILGTADDIHEHLNQTSPFVDQNQTFASHPSHQVFLRAYEFNAAGDPVNTGKLIVNRDLGADGEFGTADDVVLGGMSTWGVVKAQTRDLLGIQLSDYDVANVPMVAVDPYGNFRPGPNGFAQLVVGLGPDGLPLTADDVLLEGNPLAPISTTGAVRTGHMFLADIAHSANPFNSFGVPLTPDADDLIGDDLNPATYDNELLDRHFMAGDGRVNENIGLTAVHHVFHAEHNRLVEHVKEVLLATASTGDTSFLNQWLTTPVTAVPADPSTLDWNGARLFQAARFGTEMQYQHLVFEEFARKIQPNVDIFFAATQVYDTEINPAIVAEFAHTVYRFGHSMLLETIDRLDPDFASSEIGLIAAFLNPLAFDANGTLTAEEAAGAIVRGTTRQVGNEIDEFKTEALRNNLLGLPLDLATVNLARGRDTGIPSLNAARREFHDVTGDSHLAPYTSWIDFVQHLKHPESLVNFIAAYGTHASITTATTVADKRAAATAIVFGGANTPADRLDFLYSTGAYANLATGVTTTGVDAIDFWIGGLAEKQMPFGGFLGSTFNFVFEEQLEKLQDGDRFYYLERTAGLNFLSELENNSFAKMLMANTDATHLPGDVFSTPGLILEVDQTRQFNEGLGNADPIGDSILVPLVFRSPNALQYTGADHVVLGGTPSHDTIYSSEGDDTLYGDGGNDRLEGGYGNDIILGGDGDDIMTDIGGDDNMQGGDGNDVIHSGNGANLLLGGFGNDFIIIGDVEGESFGGPGNDFILGDPANEAVFGNEGDDWIQFGMADGGAGDNFDPFGRDPVFGNDVFFGDTISDRMDGELGDDIMVGNGGDGDRYEGFSGFDWAVFKDDPFGVTVDMNLRAFDETPVPLSGATILARFAEMEGLSGSAFADVLQGDDADAAAIAVAGIFGSVLTNPGLVDGLQAFLNEALQEPGDPAVTSFGAGNIIFGGAGSDLLEGRGGDDLIDGDRWLNVRISVRENLDGTGAEVRSAHDLVELVPDMLAGTINPGQLVIVREILTAEGPDFDTAVFSGPFANYTMDTLVDGRITVTDDVGSDGTDTLLHIERVQFSDQAFVFGGLNAEPEGLLTIDNDTPTEGQLLTVSIAGVTDGNNVSPTNPTGAITGPVSYFWQFEARPDSGIFENILFEDAPGSGGEARRATGTTFMPGDAQVGLRLRVMAVYQDANGVLEEVFSDPTAPVNDPPVGTVLISDTTPTEGQVLNATNAFTDVNGLTTAVFAYQWQQANATGVGGGAAGFTAIAGATAQTFTPGAAQVNRELRVRVSYTDDQGTLETLTSAATTVTGDSFTSGAGASIWTGTEGQDIASGGGGADILTGLGGNDLLNGNAGSDAILAGAGDDVIAGGTGNDALSGEAGNDTFTYTIGDGADAVDGGVGTDTLTITGLAGNDTLDVLFGPTALTTIEGGAVANVESVTANLAAGVDTLTYAGTTTAVTVNLTTGTASGFTTVANIENVTSGSGNDTLTGSAGGAILNTLSGGAGNDTYRVDGGETIIEAVGGGTDTVLSAAATFTLSANVDNLTLTGSGNSNGTGNSAANVMTGNTGNNVLSGAGGNDTLVGGAGNDTFTYTIGDGADAVDGGLMWTP